MLQAGGGAHIAGRGGAHAAGGRRGSHCRLCAFLCQFFVMTPVYMGVIGFLGGGGGYFVDSQGQQTIMSTYCGNYMYVGQSWSQSPITRTSTTCRAAPLSTEAPTLRRRSPHARRLRLQRPASGQGAAPPAADGRTQDQAGPGRSPGRHRSPPGCPLPRPEARRSAPPAEGSPHAAAPGLPETGAAGGAAGCFDPGRDWATDEER